MVVKDSQRRVDVCVASQESWRYRLEATVKKEKSEIFLSNINSVMFIEYLLYIRQCPGPHIHID